MDARALFLADHTRIHAATTSTEAELAAAGAFTMQDDTLKRMDEAELRASPDGLCSIVWHLWHMTRIEDVTVNVLLRGEPEVLDAGGWSTKLQVERRLVGTGDGDDDVRELSERIDVAGLLAYREAVGRRTREVVARLDFDALDAVPDVAGHLAAVPPIVGERAQWLPRFYGGKSSAFLLVFPVTNHGFMHWAEARVTRSRLGHRVP
ncbi:MAG: DinB family protein [Chloroflexi bacterium]|nr:DinB family protein [Chloroflexota bacterium]